MSSSIGFLSSGIRLMAPGFWFLGSGHCIQDFCVCFLFNRFCVLAPAFDFWFLSYVFWFLVSDSLFLTPVLYLLCYGI